LRVTFGFGRFRWAGAFRLRPNTGPAPPPALLVLALPLGRRVVADSGQLDPHEHVAAALEASEDARRLGQRRHALGHADELAPAARAGGVDEETAVAGHDRPEALHDAGPIRVSFQVNHSTHDRPEVPQLWLQGTMMYSWFDVVPQTHPHRNTTPQFRTLYWSTVTPAPRSRWRLNHAAVRRASHR